MFGMLTIHDIQARLRIGKNSAYALVKSGELPALRVGGLWRVKSSDFEDWIARKTTKPVDKKNTG